MTSGSALCAAKGARSASRQRRRRRRSVMRSCVSPMERSLQIARSGRTAKRRRAVAARRWARAAAPRRTPAASADAELRARAGVHAVGDGEDGVEVEELGPADLAVTHEEPADV